MRSQALDFLRSVVSTPSPSGFEQPVARLVRERFALHADEVRTDVMGNVIAALNPGAAMKVMLVGHMDEIGFVIHHVGEDGLLHFSAVGDHDASTPLGQWVWVHGRERVAGVVGRKAIHLLDPDEQEAKPRMRDLWIDIGAASRAEAEAAVALGDPVTFQHEFQALRGGRAMARAFDNKAGVAVVAEALRLLREEGGLHPGVGVHAVASVQEEIGSRGAQVAAHAVAPQAALVVDMGQATDYPAADERRWGRLALGAGPAIDRGANTNPAVRALLEAAAREDGVPVQVHVTASATPTDARAVQVIRGGVATALLSVPLRYMHTPGEVIDLADLDAAARLMAGFCRRLRPDSDFAPR